MTILAAACLSTAQLLQAEGALFQSAAARTSLLELYTSEGCSSCPPAETWLSQQKHAAGLWKGFVPVAFHVDYWDYLGWRDPWGNQKNADRQRAYAARWKSHGIYTPEFVLNGQEWRRWRGHESLPRSNDKPGVLTIRSEQGNRWVATFAPTTLREGIEVHAAILLSGLRSDVQAGENQGRRLTHDFVAVTLVSEPMEERGDSFNAEFELRPMQQSKEGRAAIAIWVTSPGELEPLQATGGWLPSKQEINTSASPLHE